MISHPLAIIMFIILLLKSNSNQVDFFDKWMKDSDKYDFLSVEKDAPLAYIKLNPKLSGVVFTMKKGVTSKQINKAWSGVASIYKYFIVKNLEKFLKEFNLTLEF